MPKQFAKFRAGDLRLKDDERSSKPSSSDDDEIKTLFENNPHYTTCQLAATSKTIIN